MKKGTLILMAAVLLYSCDSKQGSEEQAIQDSLDNVTVEAPAISEEVIADIVQQIPSPLEISVLIKESGSDYDKSILNDDDNASKYNSNFRRALNLGVYGTDLGYTNIYEQNQDAVGYIGAVRDLADGLNIGQFFDFSTIRKLATNSSNLDSLLLITTQNFNKINAYLQDQKRSDQSILVLTGGWIEALHVTCKVYEKNTGNKTLREKIGEQKIILEQIQLLLSLFESNPNIKELGTDLKELQTAFDKIEIVNTYAESTFKEVDGVLVIEDNSTSTVNITDENVSEITRITESIRTKIIN